MITLLSKRNVRNGEAGIATTLDKAFEMILTDPRAGGMDYRLSDNDQWKQNRQRIQLHACGVRVGVDTEQEAIKTWEGVFVCDLDWHGATRPDPDQLRQWMDCLHTVLRKHDWYFGICQSAGRGGYHIFTQCIPANRTTADFRAWGIYVYNQVVCEIKELAGIRADMPGWLKGATYETTCDKALLSIHSGITLSYDTQAKRNPTFILKPCNYDAFLVRVLAEQKRNESTLMDFHEINVDGVHIPAKIPAYDYKNGQRISIAIALSFVEISTGQSMEDVFVACNGSNKYSERTARSEYKRQLCNVRNGKRNICEGAFRLLKKHNNISINLSDPRKETKQDPAGMSFDKVVEVQKYIDDNVLTFDEAIQQNRTLLVSPPNSGKTELVKRWGKDHDILLVEPYNSVKKNKVMPARVDVVLPDKLQHMSSADLSHYELIVFDESHLITEDSTFRPAMGHSAIVLLDTEKPVLFMTATAMLEERLFAGVYKIQCRQKAPQKGILKIKTTPSIGHAKVLLKRDIVSAINRGKTALYFTNNGAKWAKSLINEVAKDCGLNDSEILYFCRENENNERLRKIVETSSVSGLKLVVATKYLSVGIDINDTAENTPIEVFFDALSTLTAQSAEDIFQSAHRLRKQDIFSTIHVAREVTGKDGKKKAFSLNCEGVQKIDTCIFQQAEQAKNILSATLGEGYGTNNILKYLLTDQERKDIDRVASQGINNLPQAQRYGLKRNGLPLAEMQDGKWTASIMTQILSGAEDYIKTQKHMPQVERLLLSHNGWSVAIDNIGEFDHKAELENLTNGQKNATKGNAKRRDMIRHFLKMEGITAILYDNIRAGKDGLNIKKVDRYDREGYDHKSFTLSICGDIQSVKDVLKYSKQLLNALAKANKASMPRVVDMLVKVCGEDGVTEKEVDRLKRAIQIKYADNRHDSTKRIRDGIGRTTLHNLIEFEIVTNGLQLEGITGTKKNEKPTSNGDRAYLKLLQEFADIATIDGKWCQVKTYDKDGNMTGFSNYLDIVSGTTEMADKQERLKAVEVRKFYKKEIVVQSTVDHTTTQIHEISPTFVQLQFSQRRTTQNGIG